MSAIQLKMLHTYSKTIPICMFPCSTKSKKYMNCIFYIIKYLCICLYLFILSFVSWEIQVIKLIAKYITDSDKNLNKF